MIKIKQALVLGLIGFFVCGSSLSSFAGESKFHPPQTRAEKSLNDTLTHATRSASMFCAIVQNDCTFSAEDQKSLRGYSASLLQAIRNEEKQLLNEQCDGVYRDHESCGIDYHPILCGQEFSRTGYVYRTARNESYKAEILVLWNEKPFNSEWAVRYFMVREKGAWVLNGVDCPKGNKFNVAP